MKKLRAKILAESLVPLSNEKLLDIYEGALLVGTLEHRPTALIDAIVIRAEVMRRLENK